MSEIQDQNPTDLQVLLESAGVSPTRDEMRTWTADQCREARRWAMSRFSARSPMFSGTLWPAPTFLLDYAYREVGK